MANGIPNSNCVPLQFKLAWIIDAASRYTSPNNECFSQSFLRIVNFIAGTLLCPQVVWCVFHLRACVSVLHLCRKLCRHSYCTTDHRLFTGRRLKEESFECDRKRSRGGSKLPSPTQSPCDRRRIRCFGYIFPNKHNATAAVLPFSQKIECIKFENIWIFSPKFAWNYFWFDWRLYVLNDWKIDLIPFRVGFKISSVNLRLWQNVFKTQWILFRSHKNLIKYLCGKYLIGIILYWIALNAI